MIEVSRDEFFSFLSFLQIKIFLFFTKFVMDLGIGCFHIDDQKKPFALIGADGKYLIKQTYYERYQLKR